MIVIISLFAVPYFILSYLVITYGNVSANILLHDLLPFFAITVLLITIYGINTMIRIYFISTSHENKINSLLVISGLYLMVFSFTSQVITKDSMNFGFFSAEIFQLAILSISVLIIAGVYLRSPQFLYVTTSKIHQFYILDVNTNIVWSYQPWPPKYFQDDLLTMSRVLVTSSSLLGEITGKEDSVREIKFSNTGRIIIEKSNNYSLIFVIEHHSRYINSAILRFKRRINAILSRDSIDESVVESIKHQFFRTFQIN